MAFRFNFTNDDLELEEEQPQQDLQQSLHDLSIQEGTPKAPTREFDIESCSLPAVIQADQLSIEQVKLYKRALADVKFQMAKQDTLSEADENQVLEMLDLNSNSDLVRGVYEGGFKTWECSIDLVQFLSQLPRDQITEKRVLELGCGSSLPSLYLLQPELENHVDVQDYNEHVIRYITIPNILLNTVLQPTESSAEDQAKDQEEREESSSSSDEDEDDEEDDEKDRILGETASWDVEAELPADQVPTMLQKVASRSRAFVGDWSGLPSFLQGTRYDMVVTSETIYSEEALPSLINLLLMSLQKPHGVGYVAAKTVYFGVGGGTLPFCTLLGKTTDADGNKLRSEKVFESGSAVKREILKLTWDL
ncbi:hypothetical protein BCR43DRAFT_496925 [Syncephalastrum racemosum]|uniref:protein-histidine N-methyltransferase n=1 Tax=Syncephalastrum racemosum TaxID=13706 RepID=A0A1X2H4X9_SYNRA|nr:hypothetical protein BCR43DRAFT_496925 [Syncephalastrum racemosum]